MTRINVIPVSELHPKHLVAEYKEITRVFGLARKAQFDIVKGKRAIPSAYTLGKGHVLFFYNKLKFVADRYADLIQEMLARGYKPNPINPADLFADIPAALCNGYQPTNEAISINRARIADRMPK